jgi:hypothetical protein
VNEHSTPASEDPPVREDTQEPPASAAARSRRLPRAGLVAAAATSRTAGWIVAAGLFGSLITLLLGPGRNSSTTIVPMHRAAFAIHGGLRSAAPGRRAYLHSPVRQKIVGLPAGRPPAIGMFAPGQMAGPGGVWVQAPAMMPACGIAGPGMLPPGPPRVYGPGGLPIVKGVISRSGKNGMRVVIIRPGAAKRVSWIWRRPLPGHRISVRLPRRQFAAGPGPFSIVGPGGPPCTVQGPGGPVSSWYGPGWSAPYVSWYGR